MTAIDRTAYPRLGLRLNHEELGSRYTLTEADIAFVCANTRGEVGSLVLAMLLKTRRDFGCFLTLCEMHLDTVAHPASQLGSKPTAWPGETADVGSKNVERNFRPWTGTW